MFANLPANLSISDHRKNINHTNFRGFLLYLKEKSRICDVVSMVFRTFSEITLKNNDLSVFKIRLKYNVQLFNQKIKLKKIWQRFDLSAFGLKVPNKRSGLSGTWKILKLNIVLQFWFNTCVSEKFRNQKWPRHLYNSTKSGKLLKSVACNS
jgi:hypothetical protein